MNLRRTRSQIGATLALAGSLLAGACAEGMTEPAGLDLTPITSNTEITTTTVGSGDLDDYALWFRRVWICKVGTNADFLVSVNGGPAVAWSLLENECKMVHYAPADDPERIDTVVVSEVASALTVLDSIVVDSTHSLNKYRLPTITGTNTVTAYTFRSKGAILTFFNSEAPPPPPPPPPPPEGGEGCTPGYWKQTQHFGNWTLPYQPNMQFDAVFADAFGDMTLLQVLGLGGGGLNALGRHTVAALLNAASAGVDYDYTVAGVIAAFNAAYASGDYEGQKNTFAVFNEQGCTVGRAD